jgi:hypothetical protein
VIPQFKKLNADEIKLMLDTPALVTILISGADEKIEKKETDWAARLTRFRKANTKLPSLQDYYTEVAKDFEHRLAAQIDALPVDVDERNAAISAELAKLNDILPKLSKEFANNFYQDMKSFAEGVAKSAGGVMSMGTISPQERQWLGLDMIDPPE